MISSFIWSYYFNTLFTKKKSLCLIYESIKTLQSNASILFKLVFTSNYFLSCLFFYFLNYWFISCSPWTDLWSYCRTHNFYRNIRQKSKSGNWNTSTIMDKLFDTKSSFNVKFRAKEKVYFLFFRIFLLVLGKNYFESKPGH